MVRKHSSISKMRTLHLKDAYFASSESEHLTCVSVQWCDFISGLRWLNGTCRDGFLDGLLNFHALACNGLVQFPLEGQEVHVGLGLRDQISDLIITIKYTYVCMYICMYAFIFCNLMGICSGTHFVNFFRKVYLLTVFQ